MKKNHVLIAVMVSLSLISTGSLYAMEEGAGVSPVAAGSAAAAERERGDDNPVAIDSILSPASSSSTVSVPDSASPSPKISFINWINSNDKDFLDWFNKTDFGSKCKFGMGLAGLYAAHSHVTKTVVAATVLMGIYLLWNKHTKKRHEIEEWADEI